MKDVWVFYEFEEIIVRIRKNYQDALSIRKRLLRSAINKRNKEPKLLSKELSLSEKFFSTQLYPIDFSILIKSITSYKKKSLQKSLHTQQKKLSSLTKDLQLGIGTYLYSQLRKVLLIPSNINYSRKNLIYLKQVYTFQFNQIKIENPKSSLPLKRFIVCFLITLNSRKPKVG